jgi:hypothetical protein
MPLILLHLHWLEAESAIVKSAINFLILNSNFESWFLCIAAARFDDGFIPSLRKLTVHLLCYDHRFFSFERRPEPAATDFRNLLGFPVPIYALKHKVCRTFRKCLVNKLLLILEDKIILNKNILVYD